MMFNPCSPCCTKILIKGSGMPNVYDFYVALGYNVFIDPSPDIIDYSGYSLVVTNLPFIYSGNGPYLHAWLQTGGKRLLLWSAVYWGLDPNHGPVNAAMDAAIADYNTLLVAIGSSLSLVGGGLLSPIADGVPPGTLSCATSSFVGPSYLSSGLTLWDSSAGNKFYGFLLANFMTGSSPVLGGVPLVMTDTVLGALWNNAPSTPFPSMAVDTIATGGRDSEVILCGCSAPFVDIITPSFAFPIECRANRSLFLIRLAELPIP